MKINDIIVILSEMKSPPRLLDTVKLLTQHLKSNSSVIVTEYVTLYCR